MATFGDWPLLERVTNEEFLELLPHLNLEDIYLTQVFIPKIKWMPMLDVNLQSLELRCNVCRKPLRFETIKYHLIDNEHLVLLRSNVKQFYHPFYTYGKGDINLGLGKQVPRDINEKALREVNLKMKHFTKECVLAKEFATITQRKIQEMGDDHFIQTVLNKNIKSPDEMVVMVCLPFKDIPKLLFCVVSGEWNAVLSYTNLTKKAIYHCNICSLNCCGIGSVNSHLNGFTHRLKQLDVLALRYGSSSKVNKNCCIHFGNTLEFTIKNEAKREIENECKAQITKLSDSILRKFKALNDYVPNIISSIDNRLKQSGEKNINDMDKRSNEFLGHLGVEYVLKILKNENVNDPRFECGLCEFVGDVHKMQRHLLYYDHKKKYLDLHYSDTVKKYESLLGHMCFKEFRAVMGEIVDKVSIEIEKHHSRSLPYSVSLKDYKLNRPDLIAEAYALLHASQNRGPSFSNIFSKDDIRNLKNCAGNLVESKTYTSIDYIVFTVAPKGKIYLNQSSHDPVIRFRDYNAKMNRFRQTQNSRSKSPLKAQFNEKPRRSDLRNERLHTHINEQRVRSRSPITGRHRSPVRRPRVDEGRTNNILNQDIWDIYRREIAKAANEIEIAYENYRKNPESHPLYEDEWNNFWQRRKKEIEREGIDHRTYNFQPEWVHYFEQRIEVLFGEALHKSQINIRDRLDIPLDAEEDCQRDHENKYNQYSKADNINKCKPLKRCSSIDYSDNGTNNKRIFPEQIYKEREEESKIIATGTSDNHSNVVHVLRLITALEDHLGCLGGKIMDLLSNALQLEKNFGGNSVEFESQVLSVFNCQLLETAVEKLKGVLFAGFLDERKISGFNRVIQHTENLLKYAEKMGWRQLNSEANQKQIKVIHNRRDIEIIQNSNEKPLSDTLLDLVQPTLVNKQQMKVSKERQFAQSEDLPDCPPPPNIKDTNINSNLIGGGYKGLRSNSGLALFNTKLSLDQPSHTENLERNQSLQSEFGRFHRNTNSGGISLYNNSFKNNNEMNTNINTRTNSGPIIGSSMNYCGGLEPQFRRSQLIPKMGENNAMYQKGGGNRNQTWSRWNNNCISLIGDDSLSPEKHSPYGRIRCDGSIWSQYQESPTEPIMVKKIQLIGDDSLSPEKHSSYGRIRCDGCFWSQYQESPTEPIMVKKIPLIGNDILNAKKHSLYGGIRCDDPICVGGSSAIYVLGIFACVVGVSDTVWKDVARGCPQGSICGPFIWNLMMDLLLRLLARSFKVCAYAHKMSALFAALAVQQRRHLCRHHHHLPCCVAVCPFCATMSKEGDTEDKLTKGEFAELIQHLSIQEILTIEYRVATNWNKLFGRKSVTSNALSCNLCVLETSSFKSLLSHIDGRKHRLQMKRVKQLYHPDYTHPKNNKTECGTKKKENVSESYATTDQVQSQVISDNSELHESIESIQQIGIFKNKTDDRNKKAKSTILTNHENMKSKSVSQNQNNENNPSSKDLNEDNNRSQSNNIETKITTAVKRLLTDLNEDVEVKKAKITQNTEVAEKNSLSGKILKEKSQKAIIAPSFSNLEENSVNLNEGNNEYSGEKFKYQTDKIIIPSEDKIKSMSNTPTSTITSQTPSSNFQFFSVKCFDSKPFDNNIYGILGVEYVIKILKSRHDISPRYECGLCELVLDGFAMQKHLEGYNHRLKFCEKHFPTAIRHYRQYMQHVPESELFKVMTPVLAKLAIAIEKHHGRNLPYECYERDFNLNRHEILAKTFSCRHASEQYGPTFTHVVSAKEIDELIKNRHKYLPPASLRSAIFDKKSGDSSSRSDIRHQRSRISDTEGNSRNRHADRDNSFSDVSNSINVQKSYMSSALHNEIYLHSGYYNQAVNSDKVQPVDDETYNIMVDDFLKGTLKGVSDNKKLRDRQKRSTSPVRNSLSQQRETDIWKTYRHMVDQELNNLDERFKQYRKDPETHPSYNEEWQKFWKRRKDELISTGIDHRKYNYQPEWVRFIKIRIEELYGQEVENLKIKTRERLCLPMSNDYVLDVKYQVQASVVCNLNETVTPTNNNEAIRNSPQVVSVLRLMTALEDSLGSLGPKIIDLLSKALHAEKYNPSHVNAVILNDDNCSLIETAMEKFKGLIITGLFEGSKKKVLKQVVNDAEILLKYAYQNRELLISQRSSINQTQKSLPFLIDNLSSNISGIIQNSSSQILTSSTSIKKSHSTKTENTLSRLDKKELASRLAASLAAQGKTDFDPQQLHQLIAVYRLIEKKKRENSEAASRSKCNSSLGVALMSSKKTLSDMLSDLLKPSSSFNDPKRIEQSNTTMSNKLFGNQKKINNGSQTQNFEISIATQDLVSSNSLTSVLQNPNDYYFNNTAQSMTNTHVNSGSENLLEQPNYGLNNTYNQQTSSLVSMYNNQYENNGNAENWGWNSNMDMNQNFNIGGPSNYSQSNWRNF
ncbi:uncharacterized protein ACRADG_000334 [Cochliomyia hominivorax]